MNRRQIIAAGCAALVPGAAPAAQTPIMALYGQYCALTIAADRHACTWPDEEAELDCLFYDERDRIESQIMALPCTCAGDFAAKVIVDTGRGCLFSDWETGQIWIEARALAAAAMVGT